MGNERLLRMSAARRHARDGSGKKIREAALVTTGEVAEAVGVTTPTVVNWESGRSVPRGAAGERWATLLEQLERIAATRPQNPAA